MPASSVPGRVSSANSTGTSTSAQITSSVPTASSSSVAVTAPSTELSIGTTPCSASPLRTASSVAWMLAHGSASGPAAPRVHGSRARSACTAASVNVPRGPR